MTYPTRRIVGNLGSKTLFAISFALLFACKEAPPSDELSTKSTTSILGTWQDEDQLMLLDAPNGEPFDVIVGFNLDVKNEIAQAEKKHGKRVLNWMILKTKRTFSSSKHQIDASCSTLKGESTSLSVSAPIQLNEKSRNYALPEQERSQLAVVGVFECSAAIAGKVSRSYTLSEDGKTLTILLGSGADEKITLKRLL